MILALAERPDLSLPLLVGGCILLGVLVGGTLLCAVRMGQAGAVKKCYLAFILFACGWLLCGAISTLGKQSFAASLGGLALFVALAIPAVILAILGLAEVRRAGPSATGRAPAVTTLVLAGLALFAVVGAFAFGVIKGVSDSPGFQAAMAPREGPPEPEQVFQDLGFSVQPPRPWIKINPSSLNSEAAAGFLRSRPEVYFMIIAEKLDEEADFELEALVNVVKANLASAAEGAKLVEKKEETLNGLTGTRLVYEATVQKQPFTYRYWIHLTPTRAYQLVAWGAQRDGRKVVEEADKAFASFKLHSPK